MKLCIVYPAQAHSAYRIAAESFVDLARKIAGAESCLVSDAAYEHQKTQADLTVLIGKDYYYTFAQLGFQLVT